MPCTGIVRFGVAAEALPGMLVRTSRRDMRPVGLRKAAAPVPARAGKSGRTVRAGMRITCHGDLLWSGLWEALCFPMSST